MHGAVWVGNVPSLTDTVRRPGPRTRPLAALAGDLGAVPRRPAPPCCTASTRRSTRCCRSAGRHALGQVLDELRLVKDEWEVGRLQHACEITARGFADVARELPNVIGRTDLRGERWLEGTFWRRARLEGNEVGYSSIVGAGRHAHHAALVAQPRRRRARQLLLADMGVETDELYTADVTRTMPVSGEWTPDQLRVYRAVQEAQAAGIAEVKAGADFLAAHRAAMWVLADHLHSLGHPARHGRGLLRPTIRRSPAPGLHRRYTLHGTSHMLGIDVHDCALARDEIYREGTLAAGHVLTVEPGLYFQANDRTVPAELRGIGVRIEDDIVVTDGEPLNLSAGLPRDPDEIIAWMRDGARPAAPWRRDREAPWPTSSSGPARAARRPGRPGRPSSSSGSAARPGPGGQGVNTTDSRVELRWDVATSAALTGRAARARARPAGARLDDGVLVIVASEHRSQLQNRTAARARLRMLLDRCAVAAAARAPGDPTVPRGASSGGWRASGGAATSRRTGAVHPATPDRHRLGGRPRQDVRATRPADPSRRAPPPPARPRPRPAPTRAAAAARTPRP